MSEHGACQWCGEDHGGVCPRVSAMEFYPDGQAVRRVEFFPPKSDEQPDKLKLTEDDESYRERIQRTAGTGTVNQKRIETAEGADLDDVGCIYLVKRRTS